MVSIDLDTSLFIMMANFLVLIVALNFLLYKPIRGILRQRAEKVAQLNNDITSNSAATAARTEEMNSELNRARRDGASIKEDLKNEGKDRERDIIDAATRDMEAAVEKIRNEISRDIGTARDELKSQVQAFGQDLAQKILGRSIQ